MHLMPFMLSKCRENTNQSSMWSFLLLADVPAKSWQVDVGSERVFFYFTPSKILIVHLYVPKYIHFIALQKLHKSLISNFQKILLFSFLVLSFLSCYISTSKQIYAIEIRGLYILIFSLQNIS